MTMNLMFEDYWLVKPQFDFSDKKLGQLCLPSTESLLELDIPSNIPKWAYLDRLAQTSQLVFHGSGEQNITLFEPRKPKDNSPDEFSKQTAVFASGDAIWAIFYAILVRSRSGLRFLNAAFQEISESGQLSEMHYFFSITQSILKTQPWRTGMVYLLPKESFVQMPPYCWQNRQVLEPQWATKKPVAPIAKVTVYPSDFPLLSKVRGHSNEYIMERSRVDPNGFPWL